MTIDSGSQSICPTLQPLLLQTRKLGEMPSLDLLVLPFLELKDNLFIGPFVLVLITVFQFLILAVFNAVLLPLLFLQGLIRYLRAWGLFSPAQVPTRVLKEWEEQIIIVTGGSSGIGQKLVELIVARAPGCQVIILDLAPPTKGPSIPKSSDAQGKATTVHYFACDVGNLEQVTRTWSQITNNIGHPTVLVNNAGRYSGKSLQDLTLQDIQKTVQTNLTGPLWLAKLAIKGMLAQRYGHVINVASLLGHVPSSHVTDYCASKHGLVGFHDALHAELNYLKADHIVRTSCVSPGHVDGTGMFAGFKYRFPWLTPHLSSDYVAKIIYRLILKEHLVHETVLVPVFAKFAVLVPLLPYYVVDFLNEILGGNDSLVKTHIKRS